MNRKMKYVLLTCVAAFGALPFGANAAPSLSAEGLVQFYNGDTNVADGPNACFSFSPVANTAVGCSGSVTTPTSGATLNYLTTAIADYGVLKAAGQSDITGASGTENRTDYGTSSGQASFEDSWTITGGTGTGTLQLQFALDGRYNFCAIGSGLTLGFGLINLDDSTFSSGTPSTPTCSGTIANTVSLTTGFTFGTPVDFLVNLLAGSTLFDLGNNVSSNIDFSDTAQMSAIIVTDANGDVIPFSLMTASGAALFSQLAPGVPPGVPEPASLTILGAGLAGLGFLRRRKRG